MFNFNRETLENLHKRQVELNKQQDILNHEYSKYSAILHRKVLCGKSVAKNIGKKKNSHKNNTTHFGIGAENTEKNSRTI